MNKEIKTLLLKSFLALAAGIPLFVVSMLDKTQVTSGENQFLWIGIGIVVLAIMWFSGRHFFKGAWSSFKAHNANMNTLVALATGPAWLYSFLVSCAPNLFPEQARHVYYDAPITVIGLLVLGASLELIMGEKASKGIEQFLSKKTEDIDSIRQIIKKAQSSKPSIGKIADKVSAILAPLVLIIALFTMSMWLSFGPTPQISYMLITFMAVLLIACPCALGLATPISISTGLGKAAKNGILFHESDAFTDLSKIKTLLLNAPLEGFENLPRTQSLEILPTFEWSKEQLKEKIQAFHQQNHPFALASGAEEDPEILKEASISIVCGERAYLSKSDISILVPTAASLHNALIISKATLRNIWQNLIGAFAYNGIAIPLAAGVLYPLTGRLLSPILAGALMASSSIFVIANANRLHLLKLKEGSHVDVSDQ